MTDDAERFWENIWQIRGVEHPCSKCRGLGVYEYSSTATWHGGIGGQALTSDVCNVCWGSGDEFRHWINIQDWTARMSAFINRNNELEAENKRLKQEAHINLPDLKV